MADMNLGSFAQALTVAEADVRLLVAYDSRVTGFQTAAQGAMARGIALAWPMPLRNDETPALVGLFGGTSSLSDTMYIYQGTHGWTTTNRLPGGAAPYGNWSDGGNNYAGIPTTEFNIAGGSSRTAYVDGSSANGNLWSMLPKLHFEENGNPAIDIFGGNPFSGLQCHARHIALGSGSAGPTDMVLAPIRHVEFWPSVNTLSRTAYPAGSLTCNFTGSSVVTHDVDCGAGVGMPGFVLRNPVSVGAGVTAMRIFSLGGRLFRSSGGAPIAGFHVGAYGTGGHTIGQACSCLGISGQTGLSPDPYVSEANATALIKAGWGRGSGNDAPTHVICYTGANYASDEQTELGAGTKTKYRDRHILWAQKMNDICAAANGGTPPKICFVFNPAHRNTYSGTMFSTALAAVSDAAASNANWSLMDLFTPSNSKSLAGGTPWASPFLPPLQKGNVYRTINSASTGPQADGSADYVHFGRGGDIRNAFFMWCRLMRSINKDPGMYIGTTREGNVAGAGHIGIGF